MTPSISPDDCNDVDTLNDDSIPNQPQGILAWFTTNKVVADLFMLLFIVGGLFVMTTVRVEIFPTIDPRTVTVSVQFPGATPTEVEEGVNRRIEEAVTGIEGVKRVRSQAMEGNGVVTVELKDNANDREVLDDVKSAVDQIPDFPPPDAEEPQIVDTDAINSVISVALYGEVPERTLCEIVYRMRDDLLATGQVSEIRVRGARDYEIGVELDERMLREYGLSFEEISAAVRGSSVNLPGGAIRSKEGDILLRTDSQAYDRGDFERLIVRTDSDGTVIRLRDVATIIDGFEDVDQESLFNDQRAMFLEVFRVGDQQALDIEAMVKQYVANIPLPLGVHITVWNNQADSLRSRISLLVHNALLGLVLVFGCLVLFLDLKLAFWTTMGIPISFLGAFIFLPSMGGSINMVSLFAFILVLGLVVDDAIVIGESIFSKREAGVTPMKASYQGVKEVLPPVSLAVLTTMVAFLPLYFAPGFLGDVLWLVPVVVISVLAISLVDAICILPAHLSHGKAAIKRGALPWLQGRLRGALDKIIRSAYMPIIRALLRCRYVTVSVSITVFLIMAGLFVGGHIPFVFAPDIGADTVIANLKMNNGTPVERTRAAVQRMIIAAKKTSDEFKQHMSMDTAPIIRNISASLGSLSGDDNPRGANGSMGSHLGQVTLELLESDQRPISAGEIADRWRERIGELPGVDSITINSTFISAGDDINVELSHPDATQLLAAVETLKTHLRTFDGVVEVADSAVTGKRELKFTLTAEGKAAGLTLENLARQVRRAYYGDEAQRVQRGRDDILVLVRYSKALRSDLGSIDSMRILLPNGKRASLSTVANIEESRGYASIDRTDRRRVISVTADVNESVANAGMINTQLREVFLPTLQRDLPGLTYSFEGADREMQESFGGLLRGMCIALIVIFALLAAQLRNYVQPLLIMSVIPLGLIGSVGAHMLLGYQLSFFSFFGMIAFAGVAVNDSLVLIDARNRYAREGMSPWDATVTACGRRFRPILFTSLTTCLGLAPMILETSLQAKLLIPVAISLAGGVAFSTVVTLVILPSLILIADDIQGIIRGRAIVQTTENP